MTAANIPINVPTSGITVLSLQKTACLCILVNLRHYSPEVLALIPVKIRQELILNIPVHEIWWLERSKFVEGLDMRTVWATITNERMPSVFLEKLNISPISKRSRTLKERYMEILGFVLLNKIWNNNNSNNNNNKVCSLSVNHYQLVLDLIFSIHYCLGIMNWRKFLATNSSWRDHFHSFPPPRQHIIVPTQYYNKYYASGQGVSDTQLLSLLLDGCCYAPLQMNIFAPSFLLTPIWAEIKYPSVLERFRQYLSKTESLWFCTCSSLTESHSNNSINTVKHFPDMLSFTVTEMIASSSTGNFKHLYLQAPNVTALSHLVNAIAYFFAVLTNYENIRTNNCTPYRHLRELTLLHEEQAQHTNIDVASLDCLFRNLTDIINYQQKLEEITLGGINMACVTQNTRGFVTALINHMNRQLTTSNNVVLNITTCKMMLHCFQVLTESFLLTNTFKHQLFHLSQVVIDRTTVPPSGPEFYTRVITMRESGYDFKHYKFSHMYFPRPVALWLLHRSHQFRLHTLELHAVRVDPGHSLLNQVAQHPNLRVRRLYISKIDIPHCYITVEDLQGLLVKTDLEVLSITECNIGENGVLQDLTIALNLLFNCRYTMVGVLNLCGNKIGMETDRNIQNFFSALFNMYSIRNLGLDIRLNHLQSRHFTLMCAEWQRCAGKKKLRQLHCQGNEFLNKQKYDIGDIARWTFV